MAKTNAPATEAEISDQAARALPRMGDTVMVKIAPGSQLINNETGGFFQPDTPTPQTVTVTLIRRLKDGDLLLA